MALRTVLEDIRVSKTHAIAFTLTRTLPPFHPSRSSVVSLTDMP